MGQEENEMDHPKVVQSLLFRWELLLHFIWKSRGGEAQNPTCLKPSVIWGAMSSINNINTAIYQEILEHLMPLSADKLNGDADFHFQQDFAPTHSVKSI